MMVIYHSLYYSFQHLLGKVIMLRQPKKRARSRSNMHIVGDESLDANAKAFGAVIDGQQLKVPQVILDAVLEMAGTTNAGELVRILFSFPSAISESIGVPPRNVMTEARALNRMINPADKVGLSLKPHKRRNYGALPPRSVEKKLAE